LGDFTYKKGDFDGKMAFWGDFTYKNGVFIDKTVVFERFFTSFGAKNESRCRILHIKKNTVKKMGVYR
jgi:hypothetical protein